MSRRKGIKNQSLFIQSNFLIPLLIVMMIFMTAMEAGSQTDRLSMNFSYCSSFVGENWGDNAGIAIASVGDVNKDDLADFLTGVPRSDSKGHGAGKAYLIFGKKSGWTNNVSLANADVTFIGKAMLDLFGSSVAGISNVNYDNYKDEPILI